MRKANLLTVGAILIFFLLVCAPYAAASLCGDFDGDEALSIFDITGLIGYLYLEGSPPPIPVQADPNHDCIINIFDITYLIDFLYLEGPAPQIGCATL